MVAGEEGGAQAPDAVAVPAYNIMQIKRIQNTCDAGERREGTCDTRRVQEAAQGKIPREMYPESKSEYQNKADSRKPVDTRPAYHVPCIIYGLCFFSGVFLSSIVTGACPVTTYLIVRVSVRTKTI